MGLMLTGVSKSFGSFQAIKELSLEVREGALFGFLGANGAGKTTTMRMILDLFRPDSCPPGAAPLLRLSARGARALSKNARG